MRGDHPNPAALRQTVPEQRGSRDAEPQALAGPSPGLPAIVSPIGMHGAELAAPILRGEPVSRRRS